MDKQELVKRLKDDLYQAKLACTVHALVTDFDLERAIAYINSTASRDEVLDTAWAAVNVLGSPDGAETTEAGKNYSRAIGDALNAIEALKSTTAPKVYLRRDGNASYYTKDTRGTVEDRRKSAHGIGNQDDVRHMWRRGAEGEHVVYGRRSNDRARWTGEAAPVVDWREKDLDVIATQPAAPVVQSGKREMTSDEYRDFWNGKNPTQPAQEAPQPEKPGLVKDFERIFCGQWQTLDRFPVDAPVQFGAVKWIVRRLAELDARQGEK